MQSVVDTCKTYTTNAHPKVDCLADTNCVFIVDTRICFQSTKWLPVRHLPASASVWYAVDDDLTGTAASFGDPSDSTAAFNIKFDTLSFDKYLFV